MSVSKVNIKNRKAKFEYEILDELEQILISSDVGLDTTIKIIERLEQRVARDKYVSTSELNNILKDEIVALLDQLEDPPTDLVRRDAKFKSYGLSEDDVATGAQVADVLAEHPELLQRPVLVKGGKAIIGRPKDRVDPFLAG